MKKLFNVKCCGALVLLLVFLTGCSASGESDPNSASVSPSPAHRQEQDMVYNLLEEKWAVERTDADALPWNMSDCLEVAFPHQWNTDSFSNSAVDGSCYHILQDMTTGQEGEGTRTRTLYWIVTDAASGESVTEQWELQAAPGASGEEAALLEVFKDPFVWIEGIDLSGGKRYLFFQQNEKKGEDLEPIHYYRVRTDSEGHVEDVLDLLPALREGNFLSQTDIMLPQGYCDSAGRCYVSDARGRVGVIDPEGNMLAVLEAQEGPLSYIGKMPEGNPLYACGSFKDKRLVILTYDGQGQKELYRGEYENLRQCLIRPNGDLIYMMGDKLLRWNVVKGTRESLYSGQNLDFGFNYTDCEGILEGADGKVYTVVSQAEGTFLYGFTDQEMETAVIRLEQFWTDDYIKNCVSAYNRTHPGVTIELKEPERDAQLQLTRTVASLSQGEGPQLLLVNRSQLQALQKAGALAELSQVLPADEQKQFFPGVLENGRIGDGMYGITYEAGLSTLVVSDQVWQGKKWTLGDVLQLVKEREQAGQAVEQFATSSGGSRTLYELVLINMGNSGLLDMQAGKCCFDSEEFRQVLELCKRWEQEARPGQQTQTEMVREGKALAYRLEGNLFTFSREYAALGEGFHVVGYPTQKETGNLPYTFFHGVAVSATADHREVIDDFLRFLVSYQTQRMYAGAPVRTDVLKDSVKEQVELYGRDYLEPVFLRSDQGGTLMTSLQGKPDGTSYLPEYLEAMNNTVPYEEELDVVRDIVREETDAYFAGDKGLEETVRVIQSRVQLYLDESR